MCISVHQNICKGAPWVGVHDHERSLSKLMVSIAEKIGHDPDYMDRRGMRKVGDAKVAEIEGKYWGLKHTVASCYDKSANSSLCVCLSGTQTTQFGILVFRFFFLMSQTVKTVLKESFPRLLSKCHC